jgi:hypothetical protein
MSGPNAPPKNSLSSVSSCSIDVVLCVPVVPFVLKTNWWKVQEYE